MTQLTFDGSIDGEDAVITPENSWYKGRMLSHSSIMLYRTCPQKWKFRYIDKIPEKPRSFFSFGKSVHAALEFLLNQFPEALPTIEETLTHYKNSWLREGYDTPQQEKWFYQEGERIIKGFYIKHKNDFKNVFQVEYKFNFSIEGVPITGFIDRIDHAVNGKVSVLDYKTGKAFDKSRVRQDPQLTLYQMAVKEIFGKEVESVTLYHLNSLTPLTVPAHSKEKENELKNVVVETAKGISDKLFEPKPDAKGHCQWCDYVQVCPAFMGKKLPRALEDKAIEPMGNVADRYGLLDQKIQELTTERALLAETLLSHFRHSGSEQVEGKHFAVKVKRDETGGDPTLEVSPV